MARLTHRYHFPDRFVAGTIGRPGERVFYLQARDGNRISSVLCEKEQVQILAEHIARILDGLSELGNEPPIPPVLEVSSDLGPLDQPLVEDFRVGTMTLAWDSGQQCVALELFSVETTDDEDDDPVTSEDDDIDPSISQAQQSMEVRLGPVACREFVARSRALVESGRPACPFCSQPMDPGGHVCPRANGYRTPLFLR
ncbi:DUF3090 domain-containing protein [Aestuariimicrobium ganziense]|uniref:DUF3090 domain-containing protein n=1 Tax=Aestuariimicrobium ganziense TaxID=2773677 RepID=UPI001944EA36|nr:DUF3090 domain-containing protein [Aestuariimicrobium ganziense]